MTLPNYYEILELDHSAAVEAITTAIKTQRRRFSKLQSNPQQEKRQLAERRMAELAEAEQVLTTPQRRADYDRQLAAQVDVPQPGASGTGGGGRDWLAIAREYIDAGQLNQADFAAREATSQQSENPEAWYLRALVCGEREQHADAEFCISEAIRLNPSNPAYHCQLGDLYGQHKMWAKGLQCYQRASDLEPSNPFYITGVASMHSAMDNPAKALDLLHSVVIQHPDIEVIRDNYAVALMDDTTNQWSRYPNGTSSILSEAQLKLARRRIAEVDALKLSDLDLLAHLAEIRRVTNVAGATTWHHSDNLNVWGGAFIISCLYVVISFAAGLPAQGLLGVAIAGLIGFAYTKRHRMEAWRYDRKKASKIVASTGLQDAPAGAAYSPARAA